MEQIVHVKHTVLLIYIVSWVIYLVALYVIAYRKKLRMSIVSVSHIVPSAVAILMGSIFLIGKGATVVQFVAYSVPGMKLWSLWVGLWPGLLVLTAGVAFTHLVWLGIACADKTKRRWIPVVASGLFMSVFSFFAVIAFFPTA